MAHVARARVVVCVDLNPSQSIVSSLIYTLLLSAFAKFLVRKSICSRFNEPPWSAKPNVRYPRDRGLLSLRSFFVFKGVRRMWPSLCCNMDQSCGDVPCFCLSRVRTWLRRSVVNELSPDSVKLVKASIRVRVKVVLGGLYAVCSSTAQALNTSIFFVLLFLFLIRFLGYAVSRIANTSPSTSSEHSHSSVRLQLTPPLRGFFLADVKR